MVELELPTEEPAAIQEEEKALSYMHRSQTRHEANRVRIHSKDPKTKKENQDLFEMGCLDLMDDEPAFDINKKQNIKKKATFGHKKPSERQKMKS